MGWETQFLQTGKKTPTSRLVLERPNETTVKTEHVDDHIANIFIEDDEDDYIPPEVTYIKRKAGNNTPKTSNVINKGLSSNSSSSSNKGSNNVRKDIDNKLDNSVINHAQQYYNIVPNRNKTNIQSNKGSNQEASENKSNHENDSIISTSPITTQKNKTK